jgi:hypothetical protein
MIKQEKYANLACAQFTPYSPVVEAHQNHWVLLLNSLVNHEFSVVDGTSSSTRVERSTVDPNHDRQFGSGGNIGGAPHVQVEAVFTYCKNGDINRTGFRLSKVVAWIYKSSVVLL